MYCLLLLPVALNFTYFPPHLFLLLLVPLFPSPVPSTTPSTLFFLEKLSSLHVSCFPPTAPIDLSLEQVSSALHTMMAASGNVKLKRKKKENNLKKYSKEVDCKSHSIHFHAIFQILALVLILTCYFAHLES